MNELSLEDLLRIFLLKFISDDDITAYKTGTFNNGSNVTPDGTAINTKEASP